MRGKYPRSQAPFRRNLGTRLEGLAVVKVCSKHVPMRGWHMMDCHRQHVHSRYLETEPDKSHSS